MSEVFGIFAPPPVSVRVIGGSIEGSEPSNLVLPGNVPPWQSSADLVGRQGIVRQQCCSWNKSRLKGIHFQSPRTG
jgi:hypothetical protein